MMAYSWKMDGEFGEWLNDKLADLHSMMNARGCSDEMIAEAVDLLLARLHEKFPDQVCIVPPRRKQMH